MKKLFFAIALLVAASFSLQAQHVDVENGSKCDALVDAGRYSSCVFDCSNSATIAAGNIGTIASCNLNTTLNYGKIWVGEPNTLNGVYVGICATDAGTYTCSAGYTINVSFTAPDASNPNVEIVIY